VGARKAHIDTIARPPLLVVVDRQWGVVSLEQLRELELSDGTIRGMLRRRDLRPLYRGVYALGHASLRPEGRWLAAVLACGPGAALSHRSAAALMDLLPTASARIDVIASRSRHPQRGIRLHRARCLDARDVTRVSGIPTTTIPRTALDLAATEPHRVERLLAQADRLGHSDAAALDAVMARNNGHLGIVALRAMTGTTPQLTRSDVEAILLDLARSHHLGAIIADHPIHLPWAGEITVDFFLPLTGVVIEVDSWRHHRSRSSFEADRARDLELTAHGYIPVRVTDRQLRGSRVQLAQLLSAVVTGPRRSRSRS
jgi:very-short-patch-repair endonuclease